MAPPRSRTAVAVVALSALVGTACTTDAEDTAGTTLPDGAVAESVVEGVEDAIGGDPGGDVVDEPSHDLWTRLRSLGDDVEARLADADTELQERFAQLRTEAQALGLEVREQGAELSGATRDAWDDLEGRADDLGDDLEAAGDGVSDEARLAWERFEEWLAGIGEELERR
jgi:hypothetical protein